MPTAAASFESPEYWDSRFARESTSYDWLVSPDILIEPLLSVLSRYPKHPSPRVLHIGCGTSGLSCLLRKQVPPSSILNVDFSHRAIELGIQREQKEFSEAEGSMKWATADLLEWQSIERACELDDGYSTQLQGDHKFSPGNSKPSTTRLGLELMFSIVIEKSCADSIACGVDIEIPLPYYPEHKVVASINKDTRIEMAEVFAHPVALLSIHLAAVTKAGGTWVAFSYSTTRFDCLYEDNNGDFRKARQDKLVPNPALLWRMEMKQEVVVQQGHFRDGVHRPQISHWLYILRRTNVKLCQ